MKNSLIAPALAVLCGLFALSTVSAAADDAAKKADAKPVNKICPVEGGDVDPKVTLVHEGKTIAFCCAGCDETFKKDPAKYMAVVAKETGAKDAKDSKDKKKDGDKKKAELNKTCPVTGDEADPKLTYDHKGRAIAFCCEPCIDDFKKDPKKYLAKLDEEAKAKKKDEKPNDGAKKDEPKK